MKGVYLTISESEQTPDLSDTDREALKLNCLEAAELCSEIMSAKKDYVDIDRPLYVDEGYYINLSAKSDEYNVYYNYISHEMDEDAILDWFKDNDPEKDKNKHEIFNKLANLMGDRDSKWPWCKKKDTDEYCKIPQSHRRVDVCVFYKSEISERTGDHCFTPALFIAEIQGTRLNPYAAILQEAAHTLVFIPKCFGMVVTRDEVEFVEFRRDPDNSIIQVYSNKFVMNGTGAQNPTNNVGVDVCQIVLYIIRCLVYAALEDLPECLDLWKNLLSAGYTLGKKADFTAQETCKCCWHFRDYADLKERYAMRALGLNWVPTPLGRDARDARDEDEEET